MRSSALLVLFCATAPTALGQYNVNFNPPYPLLLDRNNTITYSGWATEGTMSLIIYNSSTNSTTLPYVSALTTSLTGEKGQYEWHAQGLEPGRYRMMMAQTLAGLGVNAVQFGVHLVRHLSESSPLSSSSSFAPTHSKTTATNPPSSTSTSTSTPTPTPTNTGTRPSEPAKTHSSTNMIIGLAVGGSLAIIALVVALAVVCYRLRRLRGRKREKSIISKPMFYGASVDFSDGASRSSLRGPREKDGVTSPGELPTRMNMAEIAGVTRPIRYELNS